jgi:hypothetical protein
MPLCLYFGFTFCLVSQYSISTINFCSYQAELQVFLVAHQPGGAGGHERDDVPDLAGVRGGGDPPLPLTHTRPQLLLTRPQLQLGIHQSGPHIPPGTALS